MLLLLLQSVLQQANSFLGPDKNGIINTDQEMDHGLMFGQDHGIKGKNVNKRCSRCFYHSF